MHKILINLEAGSAAILRKTVSAYISVTVHLGPKMIHETDGLSHVVCLKCLGTLEFLCDFHDQCHNTQEIFLEQQKRKLKEHQEIESPPFSLQLEEDADSDKENVSPKAKKRKTMNSDMRKTEKITSYFKKSVATDNSAQKSANEGENQDDDKKIDIIGESHSSNNKLGDSISTAQIIAIKSIDKSRSCAGNDTEDCKNVKESLATAEKNIDDNLESMNKKMNTSEKRSQKIDGIPNAPSMFEGEKPKTIIIDRPKGSPTIGDEAEKIGENLSTNQTVEKPEEGSSASLENSMIDRPEMRTLRARKAPSIVKKYETECEKKEKEIDDIGSKRKIGKISDVITEEQRKEIEKFYIVDMSVVDERAVNEILVLLESKKYGCKLCDSTYSRQDKCQVHIWGHLSMKPYRCNACDFSTVTVSNIRCHVRKSHLKIKPYSCDLCDKRYATAFLLEEHSNAHTGQKPYGCDICDFTSASRQVLSYHKSTHKPAKDITCHTCGKEFYSKGRLRAHMIIHNKDKAANMCKLCSIYLCNSEALQRHCANVHSKDYVCNICGKRSKSKKALNNHRNVHTAAKYKCSLCSKIYKSSHILKEHLLKHKGIRKYKCNVCQKDFAQQSHIAAHMAVHSDKRFFCPGCNRPFNRRDNMKMHARRCDAFLANPELKKILTIREARSKPVTKHESVDDTKMSENEETEYDKTANNEDSTNDEEQTWRFGNRVIKIPPNMLSSNEIFDDEENTAISKVVVSERTIALSCM